MRSDKKLLLLLLFCENGECPRPRNHRVPRPALACSTSPRVSAGSASSPLPRAPCLRHADARPRTTGAFATHGHLGPDPHPNALPTYLRLRARGWYQPSLDAQRAFHRPTLNHRPSQINTDQQRSPQTSIDQHRPTICEDHVLLPCGDPRWHTLLCDDLHRSILAGGRPLHIRRLPTPKRLLPFTQHTTPR